MPLSCEEQWTDQPVEAVMLFLRNFFSKKWARDYFEETTSSKFLDKSFSFKHK